MNLYLHILYLSFNKKLFLCWEHSIYCPGSLHCRTNTTHVETGSGYVETVWWSQRGNQNP